MISDLRAKMELMDDREIQEMRRSENDKCTMEVAGHKQAQSRLMDDNIYFNQKVTEFLEIRKQRSAVQNQKPDYEKMWNNLYKDIQSISRSVVGSQYIYSTRLLKTMDAALETEMGESK